MKVWYHVIAALVGLATSALIVYLVFGNASEQGAAQEGGPGSVRAASTACGTIAASDVTSPAVRSRAGANLPALFDALGPIPAIAKDQPKQQDWMVRVHAASGMCMDEIRIAGGNATLAMSTVEAVDEQALRAYAAAVLQQAFTAPFNPRVVALTATDAAGASRTLVVSQRAWRAFEARQRQLGQPVTIDQLVAFRGGSSFGAADLRIVGW